MCVCVCVIKLLKLIFTHFGEQVVNRTYPFPSHPLVLDYTCTMLPIHVTLCTTLPAPHNVILCYPVLRGASIRRPLNASYFFRPNKFLIAKSSGSSVMRQLPTVLNYRKCKYQLSTHSLCVVGGKLHRTRMGKLMGGVPSLHPPLLNFARCLEPKALSKAVLSW